MTREEAIRILDPETRRETLREIPVFERIDVDQEACRLAVDALRAQQEQERNEHLTLDELREMDGEPVYIVYPGYEKDCPGHWEILERDGKWGWNGSHREYFESSYESMWLAYRRKPEEGTV